MRTINYKGVDALLATKLITASDIDNHKKAKREIPKKAKKEIPRKTDIELILEKYGAVNPDAMYFRVTNYPIFYGEVTEEMVEVLPTDDIEYYPVNKGPQ